MIPPEVLCKYYDQLLTPIYRLSDLAGSTREEMHSVWQPPSRTLDTGNADNLGEEGDAIPHPVCGFCIHLQCYIRQSTSLPSQG